MPFSPNSKLGRYEVRTRLGAGGMGEVYLAEDKQLERRVALKVLPATVAADEDRMRRFVQEAKAAAALNHPHIAHIYEIGEADGISYIAMELIDGETLRQKIHREKTKLNRLLEWLAQVADGLAKAHAAGIVHRDLKPDNIMISQDGYAKILDFGLAKLIEPSRASVTQGNAESELATAILAQPLSKPGAIMGTVGYMSPEQAQGLTGQIDQRSDIFSFGCILYEAVTMRQPFAGDTVVDSLHNIIHAQPQPITDFNAAVPVDLQRIVRRCLAKDPEARYQTIKDAAIELKELLRDLEHAGEIERSLSPNRTNDSHLSRAQEETISLGRSVATAEAAAHSTSSAEYIAGGIKRHKIAAALVSAFVLLAIAGLSYGLYRFVQARNQQPRVTSNQTAPGNLTIQRLTGNGKASKAAISPDGKILAYVQNEGGERSLWAKQISTNSNVQVVAPALVENYSNLTFTPDGSYLYFNGRNGENPVTTLFRVPSLGGSLGKVISNSYGISFSPDGKQIAFVKWEASTAEMNLMISNSDGSAERKLATRSGNLYFSEATAWSPDGKVIVASVGDDAQPERKQTLAVVGVSDGESRDLSAYKWDAIDSLAWLTDMSGLVFSADDTGGGEGISKIFAITYPGGESRRLTQDLTDYSHITLTANGKILVAVESEHSSSVWVSPNAELSRAVQITSGRDWAARGIAWTPDKRLVYISNVSGNTELWIMNADGSNQKQLTHDGRIKYTPVVSADNRYIVYGTPEGGADLWRVNIDGSNPTLLTSKGADDANPDISPDGKWVVYSAWTLGKLALWRLPIEGGEAKRLTDFTSNEPNVSPDGKFIACFLIDEKNVAHLAVIPFEGGAPLKTFTVPQTTSTDMTAKWTTDGRGITYIDNRGGRGNLWLQPFDGGAPKQLTDFKQNGIYRREWTRDGKQVAIVRGETTFDAVMITGFK